MPRWMRVRADTSWSPPPAPRACKQPPLRAALLKRSALEVEGLLEENPEVARLPFFEFAAEPPICCAARVGCTAPIVKCLLRHRASPDAVNCYGRTPLSILSMQPLRNHDDELKPFPRPLGALPPLLQSPERELVLPWWLQPCDDLVSATFRFPQPDEMLSLSFAAALLAAGCDPAKPDLKGELAAELARAARRPCLAHFFEYYAGVQAYYTLARAASSPKALGRQNGTGFLRTLSKGMAEAVCSFLAPEATLMRARLLMPWRETSFSPRRSVCH